MWFRRAAWGGRTAPCRVAASLRNDVDLAVHVLAVDATDVLEDARLGERDLERLRQRRPHRPEQRGGEEAVPVVRAGVGVAARLSGICPVEEERPDLIRL